MRLPYKYIPRWIRKRVARFAYPRLRYDTLVMLARWILSTRLGQRGARDDAAQLCRLLDRAGVEYDLHETASRLAMYRMLFSGAYGRFLRCPPAELERWIRVSGLENLTSPVADGRGVLVAGNHLGPGLIVSLYLSAAGHTPHALVRSRKIIRDFRFTDVETRLSINDFTFVDDDPSPGLMQTMAALRNRLRQGGIVLVAMDGYMGSGGLRLPLMGHERTFRTGLPLIAGLADAAIVPVFAMVRMDGSIEIRFERPLPQQQPGQEPLDYAEDVVRRYVAMLQAFWEAEPGSTGTQQVRQLQSGR